MENEESTLHFLSFLFDLTLLALGIFGARYTKQIGGGVGEKSLSVITAGFIVLGLAYIGETAIFLFFEEVFGMEVEAIEVLHRFVAAIGLGLIVYGYSKLAKFVRS